LEDEHSSDEVREMATDIMATPTTKLTHPIRLARSSRSSRSSFITNAPRFARRSTRIAFPPCEEPGSLALLNAILIFFQYLLVFTIKPSTGGKKKKKVLAGNEALRSTNGESSSEESGDSTSSESSEASEPSGSKVEPS